MGFEQNKDYDGKITGLQVSAKKEVHVFFSSVARCLDNKLIKKEC